MSDGWIMQERGWWTHAMLGGVCKEGDGFWHVYPLDRERAIKRQMTLTEAKHVAREYYESTKETA